MTRLAGNISCIEAAFQKRKNACCLGCFFIYVLLQRTLLAIPRVFHHLIAMSVIVSVTV